MTTSTAKPKPHKRRRLTPTVANIDASRLSEGVLVMNVDDVLTKNERHRIIRVGPRAALKESDLAVQFKAAVSAAARRAGLTAPISAGFWQLDVLAIWPTQRHHDDGRTTANGDSDAPLAMVKDALQKGGVIDDDMRIVSDRTWSHYIKGERRMVVSLTRVAGGEHTVAVYRMLKIGRDAALTQRTGL